MKRKLFLLTSILLIFSFFLKAQIDNDHFTIGLNPQDLGTCGGTNNSLETATITAKSNLVKSLKFTYHLPTGVEYVSGSVAIVSQSASLTITEFDISNLNAPVFAIENPGDATWATDQNIEFSIMRAALCEAVVYKEEEGGVFKDEISINYMEGTIPRTATGNTAGTPSYNLLSASIGLQEVAVVNGIVGNTYSENIDLKQGGNGAISFFNYYVVVGSSVRTGYTLSYNGTDLTPVATVHATDFDTLFYEIDLTDPTFAGAVGGNNSFDDGETITFTDNYTVASCDKTNIKHHAYWGCSFGQNCQESAPQTRITNFGASTPTIEVTRVDANGFVDICNGIRYAIKIENTNTALESTALDVLINIGLGHNSSSVTTHTNNPLWAFDYYDTRSVSNFQFVGGSAITPDQLASTDYPGRGSGWTYAFIPNQAGGALEGVDPDGAGVGLEDLDGDGFYDDLAPGASTTLEFTYKMTPRTNCGTGRYDYLGWEHLDVDAVAKDQCLNPRPGARAEGVGGLNYVNIIRDYNGHVSEFQSPSDLDQTGDFNVKIKPSLYVRNIQENKIKCNGNNLLSDDPSSVWTVTLTVPAGVSLNGTPSGFVQIGNEITYTTHELGNGSYYEEWVDFPLKLDCAVYGLGNTPFSIGYKTNLTCSSGGSNCVDLDVHCGTFPAIYPHCDDGPCNGPTIVAFDAKRTTMGWTDKTMTTKVDPATLPEDDLEKYLAGDTMHVKAKGYIHGTFNADELFFNLSYTATAAAGGANVISYVDGKINIYDNSVGSHIGSVSLSGPPTVSSVGDRHTLKFPLDSYLTGAYSDNDSIILDINFVFSKTFTPRNYYELEEFRGKFYNEGANPHAGCDDYGDMVHYGRIEYLSGKNTVSVGGCNLGYGSLPFYNMANFPDLHPNEYRPPSHWDSCVVVLPPHTKFSGKAHWTYPNPAHSIANGHLTYSQSGDVLTIRRGPGFYDDDQRGTRYQRLYVGINGTCETEEANMPYTYTHYYQNFAYTAKDASILTNLNATSNRFNYLGAPYTMNSPTPIVSGDADIINLDVRVYNQTSGIEYNWIMMEPNSNIVIQEVYDITGGAPGVPLVFHQENNAVWAEAGRFNAGSNKTIRFKAKYNNCSAYTVKFKHAWACDAYPTDFNSVVDACYKNEVEIQVEPKRGQVQIQIADQPTPNPITTCNPFHVKLLINSAQTADVVNPYVEFTTPSGTAGLTIGTVNVEYPVNSGDIQAVSTTTTGNNVRINIVEHTAIAAHNGIMGQQNAANTDERKAIIDLELRPACGFISNTPINFRVFGEDPCGDPIAGNGSRVVSNNIEISNAIPPYTTSGTVVPELNGAGDDYGIDGCGTTNTVSIQTSVSGTTGTADSTVITLSPEIAYVNGSFNNTGSNTVTFDRAVVTASGTTEIYLGLQPGVNNGDFTYTIEVEPKSFESCSEFGRIDLVNYVVTNAVSCGGTNCGNTKIATGKQGNSFRIRKPQLADAGGSNGLVMAGTGGNYDYSVTVNIKNNAPAGNNATAGYEYNVYCADAAGQISGASIYTGSLSQAIPAGGSITEVLNFTANSLCDIANGVIIEFAPSATNCMCETFQLSVPLSTGVALNLDNDNDGIPDVVEAYNGDHDGDGTPDYADADFCADNFAGINGWDCANGLPDPDGDLDGDGVPNFRDSDFPTCGGIVSGVCSNFDTDGDGIPNHRDLDSDNDGIHDIVEVGGTDTNNDGIADNLTDLDRDGLVDIFDNDDTDGPNGTSPCATQPLCVNANSTSGLFDTNGDGTNDDWNDLDGDGIPDYLDLDSDNDGCSDANEAYANANADGSDGGQYGTGNPAATNADGSVTAAAYTTPVDGNSANGYDFQEAGTVATITTQPVTVNVGTGTNATFTVTATGSDLVYQWQENDGNAWTDIANGGIYSGATTSTLTLSAVPYAFNGRQYRVIITSDSYVCSNVTSNAATLSVSNDADIVLTKVASDNTPSVGDNVTYTITVTNNGPAVAYNLVVTDDLSAISGLTYQSAGAPSVGTWTNPNWQVGTLVVGATATITIVAKVDAGTESQTLTNNITNSQDQTDSNVTPGDPTEDVVVNNPDISITKSTTNVTYSAVGDVITYNIRVTNEGNVTLTNVTVSDPNAVPTNTTVGTLIPSQHYDFTVTHTINQADIDAGTYTNVATATGNDPDGDSTSSISDDPNNNTNNDSDGDGYPDDPTVSNAIQSPSLEATKTSALTADNDGDGVIGLNDVITYTITVENTGNVTLTNVSLNDTFEYADGNSLSLTSGPSFSSSNMGSPEGTLKVGETATYTATYTIAQPAVDAGGLSNSVVASGTSPGGTAVNDTSDDGDDTDGNTTDDPTVDAIPESPSLEATKTSALTTDNDGDGVIDLNDVITYTITVENTGNVTLTNVSLNDTFEDADGNSLSLTSGPSFSSSSMGSSAGTLQVGETATYTATYTIAQPAVDAGGLSNSVVASGTSPGGTAVNDTSDDGDDTDGNTTDDPTVDAIPESPSLEATKTSVIADTDSNGNTNAGDVITYTITVVNTGNVTLTNVSLNDTFEDADGNSLSLTSGPSFSSSSMGSPAGTLQVGETATYTATYTIAQLAVDAGGLSNSVVTSGTSPGGTAVNDTSDDGDDTDGNTTDDPTVDAIPESPSLEATKTSALTTDNDGDGVMDLNDVITYTITVANTGNVTLTNVLLSDTFKDANGNSLSLTTVPSFVSADMGSPVGILQVGETATYTATYTIAQPAVDAGGLSNSVVASGTTPGGANVSDTSDDGDDTDGNTTDDSTVDVIPESPSLEATKTSALTTDNDGDGVMDLNDVITYTITVENTGNVTLSGVLLSDTFVDANGNSLSLTSSPSFASADMGSPAGTLQVGETATYTATYTIAQPAVDAGGLSNSVVASGTSPSGTAVNDTSDDGDDTDGNTTDDPTEDAIPESPSLEATKTSVIADKDSNGNTNAGDVITYTITVANTGNVTLTNVSISDTFKDANGNPLSLTSSPSFVSSDMGSPEGTLQVGEVATYTASYTIEQSAVDAGGLSNSVVASGTSPGGTAVNDTSDDGDDTDGNTTDDPTEDVISNTPSIEAVKTSVLTDNDSNGYASLNDVITYTITVENTGYAPLKNVSISDTFKDANGNPLSLTSGPSFVSSDMGSPEGTLQVGEVATYTASYTIEQSAVDAGGLSNSVVARGTSPGGTAVNDISDDGDDTDGNTTDDPTEDVISNTPSIEAVKTSVLTDNDSNGYASLNDVITYTITVENTGYAPLKNVSISDTFKDANGNPLSLTSGPSFVSSDMGSPEGTLQVGEVATYTASYTIEQSAVDAGGLSNSVVASGTSPSGTDVSDTSDDGDDTDGNTTDDPTEDIIQNNPSMSVIKSAILPNVVQAGAVISYNIVVKNTGDVTLSNIYITDDNADKGSISGSPIVVLLPGESATVTAKHTITSNDVLAGQVVNTAVGTGNSPGNTGDVTDNSDTGTDINGEIIENPESVDTDGDGNSTNDPTVVKIILSEVVIPNGFSPNDDGINDKFVIKGAEQFPDNTLLIINRWGNKVYETNSYKNDWAGTATYGLRLDGNKLPEGTYFYIFEYKDNNGKRIVNKGYIYLKR